MEVSHGLERERCAALSAGDAAAAMQWRTGHREEEAKPKQKWEVALKAKAGGTAGGRSVRESEGDWLRWRWRKSAWVDQGAPCLGQDVGLPPLILQFSARKR